MKRLVWIFLGCAIVSACTDPIEELNVDMTNQVIFSHDEVQSAMTEEFGHGNFTTSEKLRFMADMVAHKIAVGPDESDLEVSNGELSLQRNITCVVGAAVGEKWTFIYASGLANEFVRARMSLDITSIGEEINTVKGVYFNGQQIEFELTTGARYECPANDNLELQVRAISSPGEKVSVYDYVKCDD